MQEKGWKIIEIQSHDGRDGVMLAIVYDIVYEMDVK